MASDDRVNFSIVDEETLAGKTWKDTLPHKNDNYCVAEVSGDKDEDLVYVYANSLRRILIEELPYPSLSAEDPKLTTFAKNTSAFNDEFLRARIGLLPLNLPPGVVRQNDDGAFDWVEGRPMFRAYQENPRNGPPITELTGANIVEVNEQTLAEKRTKAGSCLLNSGSGGAGYDRVGEGFPVIAKLAPGQVVDVRCTPTVGIGRKHACFSPIGTVAYRIDDGDGDGDATSVCLVVEANNNLEPTAEQHVFDAMYWAEQYIDRFIRKLGPGGSAVVRNIRGMSPPGAAIVVPDETETRASVLTAELRRKFMDTGVPTLMFAAHRVPHPLETNVEFRIQAVNGMKADETLEEWAKGKLIDAAKSAKARYAAMRCNWPKDTRPTVTGRSGGE